MAFNAVQSNIYNYYLTTYKPGEVSKYDAHKKSDLRNLYNSMVKLNKESPLYLIPDAEEAARSAVDLKEMARSLHNSIAQLGGLSGENLLRQKAAFSTNPDIASANFVGDAGANNGNPIADIKLEVKTLANNQTNLGEFLSSDAPVRLPADTYSFDVNIRNLSYEFQFNINKGDTNKDVQNRLSRLISNSGIGLKAKVIDGNGEISALQITSEATGLAPGEDRIFSITETSTTKASGAAKYFGLDYTAIEPTNAVYKIDGQPYESTTNDLMIDGQFEVKLTGVSPAEGISTTIGVKNDFDSLVENMQSLFSSYNDFIHSASEYQVGQGLKFDAYKFRSELSAITEYYKEGLRTIGATVEEDGSISVDAKAMVASAENEDSISQFGIARDFANALIRKTEQITLDPMKYTMKKVVAYKNPGHNFASPYTASNYSGMLYSYYC